MRPARREWALTAEAFEKLFKALESVAAVAAAGEPRAELGRIIAELRNAREIVGEEAEHMTVSEAQLERRNWLAGFDERFDNELTFAFGVCIGRLIAQGATVGELVTATRMLATYLTAPGAPEEVPS